MYFTPSHYLWLLYLSTLSAGTRGSSSSTSVDQCTHRCLATWHIDRVLDNWQSGQRRCRPLFLSWATKVPYSFVTIECIHRQPWIFPNTIVQYGVDSTSPSSPVSSCTLLYSIYYSILYTLSPFPRQRESRPTRGPESLPKMEKGPKKGDQSARNARLRLSPLEC